MLVLSFVLFSSLCLSNHVANIWFFTYFFYCKKRIFFLLFPVTLDVSFVTIHYVWFFWDYKKTPPPVVWHSLTQNQFHLIHKQLWTDSWALMKKGTTTRRNYQWKKKTLLYCFTNVYFGLIWYSSGKLFGII